MTAALSLDFFASLRMLRKASLVMLLGPAGPCVAGVTGCSRRVALRQGKSTCNFSCVALVTDDVEVWRPLLGCFLMYGGNLAVVEVQIASTPGNPLLAYVTSDLCRVFFIGKAPGGMDSLFRSHT
jgi:hypothetical protein